MRETHDGLTRSVRYVYGVVLMMHVSHCQSGTHLARREHVCLVSRVICLFSLSHIQSQSRLLMLTRGVFHIINKVGACFYGVLTRFWAPAHTHASVLSQCACHKWAQPGNKRVIIITLLATGCIQIRTRDFLISGVPWHSEFMAS